MTDRPRPYHRAENWAEMAADCVIDAVSAVANALLAIHDTLADLTPKPTQVQYTVALGDMQQASEFYERLIAADRYAANEARQREEQLEDAWRSRDWESVRRLQGEAEQREAEPDPLDENDHRDRLTAGGLPVKRKGHRRWVFDDAASDDVRGWPLESFNVSHGPLAFAPDADPAPAEADPAASRGEGDPEGGSESQRRNLNAQTDLLCPSCGHDIDRHIIRIDGMRCRDWRGCECHWWPSWIAAKLIKQAVKEAAQ